MPKTLIPSSAGVKNPSLVAFTPRQVLLSLSNSNSKMTAGKPSTLNKEDKALLLHAIAQYLQRNGFSKTFKKFRSEAQLEEDGCKGSTLDLEEICFRYLEKVKSADTNSNGLDQEEGTRKRRKKSSESGDKAVGDQSGGGTDKSINGKLSLKEKKGGEKVKLEGGKDNANKKDKKEKDRKSVSEALVLGKVNQPSPEAEKSKDKKKKKSKSSADATIEEVDAKASVTKKRKREDSEKDSHTDNKSLDESKHGKKDILKEDTAAKTSQHDGNHLNAGQNGQVDFTEIQKTPSKPIIVKENGTQKTGEKSDTTKSTKKQCNGSADPQSTTVKAFQRVKVDEVEFANERLKDNSYWAKDGADSGYGAKAQEVLGQVRGRDFRHEKTKKKRGSYRGGQIDLQSHSVKFNYSDEE